MTNVPRANVIDDGNLMTTVQKHQLLLVALVVMIGLPGLGAMHLWDEDEAYFGRIVQEMRETGNYIVPCFNGEVSLHKPILMYWVMCLGIACFGENEFALRIGSLLFNIGNVLLTYQLGRCFFGKSTGLWSAAVLATCLQFQLISRAAVADAELLWFVTLPLLLFVRAIFGPDAEVSSTIRSTRDISFFTWVGIYASIGLAVLTKGPIGLVFPVFIIGTAILSVKLMPALLGQAAPPEGNMTAGPSGRQLGAAGWILKAATDACRTILEMRPLTGLMTLLVVAGPWYFAVGWETSGEWLRGFFFVHNVSRFNSSFESHGGSVFYYLAALCLGLFPWCIFNYQAALSCFRGVKPGAPAVTRAKNCFLLLWAATWVGVFTAAGTKLPHYILPAYPAIAVLFGRFLADWTLEPSAHSRAWLRVSWLSLVVVGVMIMVGAPIAARIYAPSEAIVAVVGIIPLVAGLVGLAMTEVPFVAKTQWRNFGAPLVLTTASVFGLAVFAWVGPRVDRHQNGPALAESIRQHAMNESPRIATCRMQEGSYLFYCRSNIPELASGAQVGVFLNSVPGNSFLIVEVKHLAELKPALPSGYGVLYQARRFPRMGDVALIGPVQQAAARQPAEISGGGVVPASYERVVTGDLQSEQ